jgi:hypothetical protein
MSDLNSGIRAAILLGLVSSGLCTSGCVGRHGLSLVDYQSVEAARPPQTQVTLWAGSLPVGTLFVEVFEGGRLRSCLSAPPYYQQMAGKYSEQAFYLEDGSRIEIEPSNNGREITLYSPSENALATFRAKAGDPIAADCFARAPMATR